MRELYLIEHIASGRRYVAMARRSVVLSWEGHLSAARGHSNHPLHVAIRTHGHHAFSVTYLEAVEDRGSRRRQRELMAEYGSFSPAGFNKKPKRLEDVWPITIPQAQIKAGDQVFLLKDIRITKFGRVYANI